MMHKNGWLLLLSGLAGCTMGPDYHAVTPLGTRALASGIDNRAETSHS